MNHEQQGIRIKDERGKPILEVGPHTMRSHPKFAEQIGIITAYWAQAEANLNCLFAILLFRICDVFCASLATENLSGAELNSVLEALDKLDEARAQRNRVQHDIWALKGVDIERLFTIHTDQYFNFVIELMTLSEKSESTTIEDYITSAVKFAAAVSNSYTIADLQFIAQEIDIASQLVLKVMFSIRLARGNS